MFLNHCGCLRSRLALDKLVPEGTCGGILGFSQLQCDGMTRLNIVYDIVSRFRLCRRPLVSVLGDSEAWMRGKSCMRLVWQLIRFLFKGWRPVPPAPLTFVWLFGGLTCWWAGGLMFWWCTGCSCSSSSIIVVIVFVRCWRALGLLLGGSWVALGRCTRVTLVSLRGPWNTTTYWKRAPKTSVLFKGRWMYDYQPWTLLRFSDCWPQAFVHTLCCTMTNSRRFVSCSSYIFRCKATYHFCSWRVLGYSCVIDRALKHKNAFKTNTEDFSVS